MKKLSKIKLNKVGIDILREEMPVLDEAMQRSVIGGANETWYSWAAYESMLAEGNWAGGYVHGVGYIGSAVTVTGVGGTGFGEYQYFSSTSSYIGSLQTNFWDSLAASQTGRFDQGLTGMYRDYYMNQHLECISALSDMGYNDGVYINIRYSETGSNTDLSTIIQVYNADGDLIFRSSGNW